MDDGEDEYKRYGYGYNHRYSYSSHHLSYLLDTH